MKKKSAPSSLRFSAARPTSTLDGSFKPLLKSPDALGAVVGTLIGRFELKAAERAGTILPRAGAALGTPGLRKRAVFPLHAPRTLFAYSADPKDPSRIVRETASGKRVVGRIVGGKFKAG